MLLFCVSLGLGPVFVENATHHNVLTYHSPPTFHQLRACFASISSVCVILNGKMVKPESGTGFAGYSQYNGFAHLAAGLCCGLSSLASGLSIGIAADSGTRAVGAQSAMAASWKKMGFTGDAGGQPTSSGDALFVGTVLIQVFAGNLGLYGLISALILSQMDYACESGN